MRDVLGRSGLVALRGLARDDVAARVEGLGVRWIIGNHGMETGGAGRARWTAATRAFRPDLERVVLALAGVELEDKGASLSLHYRRAPARGVARATLLRALAELEGRVRVIAGKCVLNVMPRGAPHKGTALDALLRRTRRRAALFVGDDVTDEDVFAHGTPGVLGVRVGRHDKSAAPWFVRDQRAVDPLLAALVDARRAPRPG